MTSICLFGSMRFVPQHLHTLLKVRSCRIFFLMGIVLLLLPALFSGCDSGSDTWGGCATPQNNSASEQISAHWSKPLPNATLSGTAQFSLTGSGLVNVEIFHKGAMISRCKVASDGKSAQAQIDTTRFADGTVTLTAHAWNSPAGQPFTLETDAGELTFLVNNSNDDYGNDSSSGNDGGGGESGFVPSGYKKIFSDEFDGAKDAAFYERWNVLAPWGVQWYSDSDQKQAFIDAGVILGKGLCTFEAKKSDVLLGGYQWISSGSLTTNRTFVHGYFEARVWMPDADKKGAWPAFWLTSSTRWPPEWDIFEVVSSNWKAIYQYDHMPSGQSSRNISGSTEYYGVDVRDGYHTYGFLWTSKEVSWYVDGVLTRKVGISGAGDDPMWLNISQQVGGSWPGYPDSSTKWPMNMHVDYVRVYQN